MSQPANVYKSNALVESSYRLGVVEQRILLTCLSQLRKGQMLTDQQFYNVSVRDIGTLAESGSKSIYAELANAAKKLRQKGVFIAVQPNGGGPLKKVMETSWVQTCVYVESEGRIELRFNKDMIPYLSELQQQFTRYALDDVIRMTSAHGIRLFELLMQYLNFGKRDITVDEFRDWFRLEDAYLLTSDLRRKVVEPAVEQVNKYSSLVCKCETVKSGRKVTHFRFTFSMKRGATRLTHQIPEVPEQRALLKKRIVTEAEVDEHARPGESRLEARSRIETNVKRYGTLDRPDAKPVSSFLLGSDE